MLTAYIITGGILAVILAISLVCNGSARYSGIHKYERDEHEQRIGI